MEPIFCLICFAIVLILICIQHLKNVEYIRNNSIRLKELRKLNQEQDFKIFRPSEKYYKRCGSKQNFDSFNRNNYAKAIIGVSLNRYIQTLNDIKHNEEAYNNYQEGFKQILNQEYDYEKLTQSFWLPPYLFKKLELIEFEKEKLRPPLNLEIKIAVSYTSPRSRNHYYKDYKINTNDIEYYCNECIKLREYRQSAKFQRSLMTDKLRYQVLNRDHHKCVICGATAKDGAKLHVDHIVPVSKGGLTEMSNLRTLCERCNLGKGASYNPNGYN